MSKNNTKQPRSLLLCSTESTEESSAASTALSISPLEQNPDRFRDTGNNVVEFGVAGDMVAPDTDSADISPNFQESDYMIAPSTKEAKENERYARKVGINL